jgi:hypothetical protein
MEEDVARIINYAIPHWVPIFIEGTTSISNIIHRVIVIWFPRFRS